MVGIISVAVEVQDKHRDGYRWAARGVTEEAQETQRKREEVTQIWCPAADRFCFHLKDMNGGRKQILEEKTGT